MLDVLAAPALIAGALILLVGALPWGWVGGLWFRARGGWDRFGFAGKTKDLVVFAAWATAPWVPVAPVGLALPWAAALVALVFVLTLGAASLAHGNSFDLGEWRAGTATDPEYPMDWLFRERPGMDEDARTALDAKAAALRIALMILPAVGAAIALGGIIQAWTVLLLLVCWPLTVTAARARRGEIDVAALKRRLRVDRWAEDQGMKRGWELLEFMAGAWVTAAAPIAAAGVLAGMALQMAGR